MVVLLDHINKNYLLSQHTTNYSHARTLTHTLTHVRIHTYTHTTHTLTLTYAHKYIAKTNKNNSIF